MTRPSTAKPRNHSHGLYTIAQVELKPGHHRFLMLREGPHAGGSIGYTVSKFPDFAELPQSTYLVVEGAEKFGGGCDCPAKWRLRKLNASGKPGGDLCKHEKLCLTWRSAGSPIGALWKDTGTTWDSKWEIAGWLPGFEPTEVKNG